MESKVEKLRTQAAREVQESNDRQILEYLKTFLRDIQSARQRVQEAKQEPAKREKYQKGREARFNGVCELSYEELLCRSSGISESKWSIMDELQDVIENYHTSGDPWDVVEDIQEIIKDDRSVDKH